MTTMMPATIVSFSANDYVLIKLKERGRRIYFDYYHLQELPPDDIGPSGYPKWNEPDANGYVRFQFHELLRIFGPHVRMDMDGLPFETTIKLIA